MLDKRFLQVIDTYQLKKKEWKREADAKSTSKRMWSQGESHVDKDFIMGHYQSVFTCAKMAIAEWHLCHITICGLKEAGLEGAGRSNPRQWRRYQWERGWSKPMDQIAKSACILREQKMSKKEQERKLWIRLTAHKSWTIGKAHNDKMARIRTIKFRFTRLFQIDQIKRESFTNFR